MAYTGENIKDLDIATPTEGASYLPELNDSDREIKKVLKNQFAVVTKTAAYTLTAQDSIALCDGTFTVTLPTPSTVAGGGYIKEYTLRNIGIGTITVGGTIDGVANPTISAGHSFTFYTDGASWFEKKARNAVDSVNATNATNYAGIPSGTKMFFYQASAPTGWTQDTTHNDKALRVVSGAGGGSGGSLSLSAATTGGHTLTISEMPAHNHVVSPVTDIRVTGTSAGLEYDTVADNEPYSFSTQNTGGDGSHNHPLALAYIDVIIATKN